MQQCEDQIRATLEEEGVDLYTRIGDRVVLSDIETGALSLWTAGESEYVVEVGGIGYKYVEGISRGDVDKLIRSAVVDIS